QNVLLNVNNFVEHLFGVAFLKRQLEYITPFKELTQYLKQYLYPTKCFANVPFKSTINRTMTMFD
ncbi:hypothetical protein EFL67_10740, partial [Weissella confusa]|nr:hypothetical protein [Weissella confusa]